MKAETITGICGVLIAMTIRASSVSAARKTSVPETPLTEVGRELQELCAEVLPRP